MRFYKLCSVAFAVIFAVVGLIFLLFPDAPLVFFNSISRQFGWEEAPLQGQGFYGVLACAYMYLVTLLAVQMYRHPTKNTYPFLLMQAKFASSALSIFMYLSYKPYLVYFANFVIDGFIAIFVLLLIKRRKAGAK